MDLGPRIRRARKAAKKSQVAVARELGVSPSTIAGWEIGTHTPRLARLDAVADALGVTVADLLGSGRRKARAA